LLEKITSPLPHHSIPIAVRHYESLQTDE